MALENYGRTSLSEFLKDQVVYRNLETMDPRLPGFRDLCEKVGLSHGQIPRKSEAGYARLVVQLLLEAQILRAGTMPIKRLLFIGDTQMLDRSAFVNLCLAGGWSGLAFIASEDDRPPKNEIVPDGSKRTLYLANRWGLLSDFGRYASIHEFPVDESTAVVVDIDKTALGARGRNGHVIDQARIQAVEKTVASLLGPIYNREIFQTAYSQLNLPEFHSFTGDNQDYVAYLCLILGYGLYSLEAIVAEVRSKRLVKFNQFISRVEERRTSLPPELAAIHNEIYIGVKAGDPTPFKSFRRTEYLTTISRFGQLEDSAPVKDLLAQEILITQEVRIAALAWQNHGALLFGLSDKPDEAAIPTPDLAEQGYQSIHRTVTHAVGEAQ
jgi:hypothetical protein